MAYTPLSAQYFLTGEVKDSHGDKLQNVSILSRSTGERYRTGVYGDFRIVSHTSDDSLSFSFNGYESYTTLVSAAGFLQVTLRRLPFIGGSGNNHLISATSQPEPGPTTAAPTTAAPTTAGSTTAAPTTAGPTAPDNLPPGRLVENPFVPQSATVSFQAGINRASYSYVRRFLDMGLTVPPEAVKIEEMLNYFNSYYEEPEKKCLFHCSSDLLSCPWNPAHKLLFLNVCARKVDIEKAPPSNLVFLIDASGSMDMPNKMPLVKSGFRSLIENLRDKDAVSLVQYGGRVGVRLEGISGSRQEEITRAIEEIQPDGPTPGETGIRLAYEVAQRQFIPGGNNRIILITDGDINEGLSTENELEELIGQQGQAGIHLTCLGIGMDSSQNSRLADLAEKGQGNFAYVSEEEDMGQLLVKELAPAKFAVADNVCITTEFDSSLVKEYRLIGFDNKKNALEDTSFRLEGSTVGSGHSILALFEIVPKIDTIGIDTIARVKIHYCLPGQNAGQIMNYSCLNNPVLFDRAETSLKKAACIAIFGMKLKESGYAAQMSWIDMEKMTKKTFTGNYFMDRQYIALVSKARKIYERRPAH
jgi:Ca-activated chloride channel family protein